MLSTRRRKWYKRCAGFGLAIVLCYLLSWPWSVWRVNSRIAAIRIAGEPVCTADIYTRFPIPSDSDNAGPLIKQTLEILDETHRIYPIMGSEEMILWRYPSAGDDTYEATLSAGRRYISDNAAAFALIKAAASKPAVSVEYAPTTDIFRPDGSPIGFPEESFERTGYHTRIAAFLNGMAWVTKEDGDVERFFEVTRVRFALADQLEKFPDVLAIDRAMSINRLACRGIIRWLDAHPLNAAQLGELERILAIQSSQKPNCPGFFECVRAKYIEGFEKNTTWFETIQAAPATNRALKQLDSLIWIDKLPVERAGASARRAMESEENSVSAYDSIDEFGQFARMLLRFDDSSPRRNNREWLPFFRLLARWKQETPTYMSLARAVVAIERYRLENAGELPASFVRLVPEYVDAVPRDYYSGEPIQFEKLYRGYRVSSSGYEGLGGNVSIVYEIGRTE
jgi:hypothetical protein